MAKITMRFEYTDDEWGYNGLGDIRFFFDEVEVPFCLDVISMAERLCGTDPKAAILVCDCAPGGAAWHDVGDIITTTPDERTIRWQFVTDWKLENLEQEFFSNRMIFPQNDTCMEFDRVHYAQTTLAAIETLIATAKRRGPEEDRKEMHSIFLATAHSLVESLKRRP